MKLGKNWSRNLRDEIITLLFSIPVPGNYYAHYSRQEVERTRTSKMFMIFHASSVKLATGKYRIISRQLGSFEVLFSRPAEVSVAMGEWATVNFCPCNIYMERFGQMSK